MASEDAPVRFRITVEARPREEDVEWTRAEWDAMSPAQRVAALDDAVDAAIANAGGAGYHALDPADEEGLTGG